MKSPTITTRAALTLINILALAACTATPTLSTVDTELFDQQGKLISMAAAVPESHRQQVVYIGELHTRYDHHLQQLTVIRQLHERNKGAWVVAMEMFQQPVQKYLDVYIAGQLNEEQMLSKTEYFERWGYDYRLYQPILRYAREQGIALIALNADADLSRRVATVGVQGLAKAERQQLPQLDKSDTAYRDRLQEIFQHHPGAKNDPDAFTRFYEAQLLWDESMAQRAADYLTRHPDESMIVLAGQGHLAYRSGIPQRLQRRLALPQTLLIPVDDLSDESFGADYVMVSKMKELEPAGRMGVQLDLQQTRQVRIGEVTPDSAASRTGLQKGDQIMSIAGRPVQSLTDVRLALLDKTPGQQVDLVIQRQLNRLALTLTLQ